MQSYLLQASADDLTTMASGVQEIKTRILILSDTHGEELPADLLPETPVDVSIHCGDLTDESKLSEFEATLRLLQKINAPLKLVIAGNHDFTLDTPAFKQILAEAQPELDRALVIKEFGDFDEARHLLKAESSGITFLDEGTHHFTLQNGAALKVFASPYTPSKENWGFRYRPEDGHDWQIQPDTDIVITHGPPRGILDRTASKDRIGSSSLFTAVAKTRPRLHCFGHVHAGWGAKLVTWRKDVGEAPSHFTAINNAQSPLIESLSTLSAGKFDTREIIQEKMNKLAAHKLRRACWTSHCEGDPNPVRSGAQTLFVNAAIQGTAADPFQLPWIVEIALPKA